MSSTIRTADFRPARWLSGPHVQSVLAAAQPRRWLTRRRAAPYRALAEELLIDCGRGVRLIGKYNGPAGTPNGRLVVLIHGWEGSGESVYNLSLGPRLQELGFATLRLNLRDHGDSHHLNEELFHSCRLDEVVGAFQWIARRFPGQRLSVVGYSLGGNFGLRVAREAVSAGLEFDKVVAVCPVLDPAQTMSALVNGPAIYERYFINKWRRSLYKKRDAFPARYTFESLTNFDDIGAMTEYFVLHYTEFDDLHTYLQGYALTEGRLDALTMPSVMLLADDDPVIPIRGLATLAVPSALQIVRSPTGGHCGFLQKILGQSWADNFIVEQLG